MHHPLLIVALACLVFIAGATISDIIPPRARGGSLYREVLSRNPPVNSDQLWFTQLIDHNDASIGTFQQRYYVDNTSSTAGGPLFVYIGGEGPLNGTPGGSLSDLARKLGATIIALEHRWYGKSLPFDGEQSTKNLFSLTVEQAIEDLASFTKFFISSLPQPPSKVLCVGGSYPGALSAWFRQRHPGLIDASWSSSGVVNAVYDFTDFDKIVSIRIGNDCAQAIHAVTAAFEAAWEDATAREAMFVLFNAPRDLSKQDFAWALADAAAMGDQYGGKVQMCKALLNPSLTPLEAFANFTADHYGPGFMSQCYYNTACLSNSSRALEWVDQRTWVWQCCYELAYWQVAYPGSLRSSAITLDYYYNQCQSAFGPDFPTVRDPTKAFNKRWQGNHPNTTKVFAAGGGDDPWLGASITRNISSTYLASTADCSGCGHCGDLHGSLSTDPPQLTFLRTQIFDSITSWLQD